MKSNNLEQATILIVDDNPINLRLLFHYLKTSGFKTLVATSGEKAIQQAERLQPDLILLDVMMPGIDGFETCRRLKKNELTKNVPVIFITALSDMVDKLKGFKIGGVDYIVKPFHQEEVLARVNTHLTLQRQKHELYKLNATKDKFFSIIAHDIKGALTGLLGISELLSDSVSDFSKEEVESIAGDIYNSARNTYKLLENLLNWARIQSGAMVFQPEMIGIHEICNRSMDILEENAKMKGIELSNNIEPNMLAYGDSNMTDTILRNIITNAVKFTMPGGSVTISAQELENFIEIAVSDTGIGISQYEMRKLFRIDETLKKEGTNGEDGTGLGLILCKELVDENGGTIWAKSELDEGTTFHFTLRKTDAPLPSEYSDESQLSTTSTRNSIVLGN